MARVAGELASPSGRRVRPAVVLGDDFNVQVVMAPLELVLEADVGKMHALIEVRQVVVARPLLDLARSRSGRPLLSARSRLRACRKSWYSRLSSRSMTTSRTSAPRSRSSLAACR